MAVAHPHRASCRAFRHRGASPGVRVGGVLLSLLIVFGCANGADKKLIVSANTLQDSAAKAYDAAKDQESAAGAACAARAKDAGVPLPQPTKETIGALLSNCKALGAPLPYDPFKLADLAGPINGSYEAIRAADAIRRGVAPGDQAASLAAIVEAIGKLWQAAADVGVKLPENTLAGGAK